MRPFSAIGADAGAAVDRRLWENLQSGDAAAFELLFRRHATPLTSFARTITRDGDAAAELIQSLFCWIWEHRHALETPASVRAYLFTATKNRSLNHLRSERASLRLRERIAASDPAQAPALPDDDAELRDFEAALADAVGALPPRCRDVFTLARVQGLRHADIAGVLGIAPKTVEIHMGRALKLLRTQLRGWLGS